MRRTGKSLGSITAASLHWLSLLHKICESRSRFASPFGVNVPTRSNVQVLQHYFVCSLFKYDDVPTRGMK